MSRREQLLRAVALPVAFGISYLIIGFIFAPIGIEPFGETLRRLVSFVVAVGFASDPWFGYRG